MRQIFTVFAFTYKDAFGKKAFKISTLIILVAIAVICAIPRISSAFGKEDTPQEDTAQENTDQTEMAKVCYYLDEAGLIPEGLLVLQEAFPGWTVKEGTPEEENSYREQIREKEDVSLVKVTVSGELPFITVVNKNFMSGIAENTV